jgi:hypothetical protein
MNVCEIVRLRDHPSKPAYVMVGVLCREKSYHAKVFFTLGTMTMNKHSKAKAVAQHPIDQGNLLFTATLRVRAALREALIQDNPGDLLFHRGMLAETV